MIEIRKDLMKVTFDCDRYIIAFIMHSLFHSRSPIEKSLIEIAHERGYKTGILHPKDGRCALTDESAIICAAFVLILNDKWFDEHDTIQHVWLKDLTGKTRLYLKNTLSGSKFTASGVIRLFNSARQWIGILKFNTYKSMKY